jgi:hypothetical protein
MKLDAELIMKLKVLCNESLDVKNDGSGYLRVIPIIGGTFEGKINGEVIQGGADWNTSRENGTGHVFAKYLIKTQDGEYIGIENEGKININDKNYIKTFPKFQVDFNSKYAWLNTGVYVASLEAGNQEGQVEIIIYKMN